MRDRDFSEVTYPLTHKNQINVYSSLKYNSVQEALAIAGSVSPDNLQAPSGLLLKTWNEGKNVNIQVFCVGRVETVLSTLNDLFACIQVAEKTIKTSKAQLT